MQLPVTRLPNENAAQRAKDVVALARASQEERRISRAELPTDEDHPTKRKDIAHRNARSLHLLSGMGEMGFAEQTGFNWNNIINQGFNLTNSIISQRAGTFNERVVNPDGSIAYRTYRQPGQDQTSLPVASYGLGVGGVPGGGTSGLLIIGGIGLVVLMVMMKR